jgi:release factor glutamine methyltransferase
MIIPPGPCVATLLAVARARIDAVDAEWLLAHALGRSHGWLYAHADDAVDDATRVRYENLVERRSGGEPVAYLTGRRGFWTLDLQVTRDTLIPRVETERLVELALQHVPTDRAVRIADLGTGSGAIALAIASERPRAEIVATDASGAALGIASGNARSAGIGTVQFRQGDWCQALGDARFDLIVSNPPYLAASDPHASAGDLLFEPASALVSGEDGLDAIRAIAAAAPAYLLDGGWLLLEHGWEQGNAVRDVLAASGFVDIATEQDLERRDRVTLGRVVHAIAGHAR